MPEGDVRKPWHHATGSRHERGYDAAWVKQRKRILLRDLKLCQPCARQGRPTWATEVDHIVPKERDGPDDDDNLQAICGPCHDAKTAAEQRVRIGARPRISYDASGMPIWPAEGGE